MTRQPTHTPHIGWRMNLELRERFEAFLATQPPITRTAFLDAALAWYLDHAEHYGIDPLTLRPRTRKK